MVRDLTLSLPAGHIGCLLGESGCGKTTVLRAIAGFEPLRAGRILLDGTVISTPDMQVAPESRRVGMMFQDYALFPHLTVAQNVAFGLRSWTARRARGESRKCWNWWGSAMPLPAIRTRSPAASSSAWRWPALAPSPELLLLDEPSPTWMWTRASGWPSSARDPEGHRSHRHPGHAQQAEAFAIADRIGVMSKGRIAQWDTPYNLHHHPADAFVRDFIRSEALEEQREQVFARGR